MITLPTSPAPERVESREVNFSNAIEPVTGGKTQTIKRLGDRMAITFTMPPMVGDEATDYLAYLRAARREGGRMRIYEGEVSEAPAGSPVASTAGQLGEIISVSGFAANAKIKGGRFFNLIQGGIRYLYMVKPGGATANGSGVVNIPIMPALKLPTASGSTLDFATPIIEGSVNPGSGLDWVLSNDTHTRLSFTIKEDR